MAPELERDATPFQLHLCGPEDREEQARLYNACFKKPLDVAGLAWRYDANPCGRAISLLARPPEASGVSGYACNPRTASVHGEHAALIGETGDVMTHPDWRKRGIFSRLDRAAMAEARRQGWPLCFGLPNRRSAHIFLELDWERVGTLRAWSRVLVNDASARAERAKQGRFAAWTTFVALRHARKARRQAAALARGQRLHPIVDSFPKGVGELSREVEGRFAFMVRREQAYLDWRFLRSPSGLHRAFEVRDITSRFAGYCVVQVPREGSRVGYLVDVLARDEGSLSAAIEGGIDALERAGASLVEATAIDGSWWQAQLERHGFVAPRKENFLTIILHVHAPEHPLAAAARAPSQWYFTDGDRDDETMG